MLCHLCSFILSVHLYCLFDQVIFCKVYFGLCAKMGLEELIHAVEKHPEVYDSSLSSYHDRYKRKLAWLDICKDVFMDWESLTETQQKLKEKEIQTRWRSIRDRFRKDFQASNSTKSGSSPQSLKTHPYFKELMFLQKTVEVRETSTNLEENSSEMCAVGGLDEEEETEYSLPSPLDIERSEPENSAKKANPPKKILSPKNAGCRKKSKSDSADESFQDVLSILNNLQNELHEHQKAKAIQCDDDEATCFAKSLIVHIRQVPENKLLQMKVAVLNCIDTFIKSSVNPEYRPKEYSTLPPVAGPQIYSNTYDYSVPYQMCTEQPSFSKFHSVIMPNYTKNTLQTNIQSSTYPTYHPQVNVLQNSNPHPYTQQLTNRQYQAQTSHHSFENNTQPPLLKHNIPMHVIPLQSQVDKLQTNPPNLSVQHQATSFTKQPFRTY
ncbi:uncharacterized protein LOC121399958 [Xenopus laevis]|uniref:Uncharacterized protein LOC121399958 n=1 Tax=Xenopus laevis TaxID=8355 RepID=A0A8J1M9B5_XENLA|nr:uncharacterized protein LOC121399958 [Xenopus laevis]